MSKKRKKAYPVQVPRPKGDVVWRQSAEKATLASKPRYNGFACGHGAHGPAKYSRARAKQAWRRQMRQEGASRGSFFFGGSMVCGNNAVQAGVFGGSTHRYCDAILLDSIETTGLRRSCLRCHRVKDLPSSARCSAIIWRRPKRQRLTSINRRYSYALVEGMHWLLLVRVSAIFLPLMKLEELAIRQLSTF